jgi:cyclopropane fatty-acyl-phospholipid synthase-like methyltransferase
VGCGCGAILLALHSQLPNTVFDGYDISPQAISMAERQQFSSVSFHCGDFLKCHRTFDVVLLMDVVEHIEDCFTFLRTIRRSAKSVIVHFPLDMSAYGVLRGAPMSARSGDGHIHYFSKDTALSTMEECGYEILDWFYTPKQELSQGFKSSLSYLVRRSMYSVAPDFTVLALGCYGLLVAAR